MRVYTLNHNEISSTDLAFLEQLSVGGSPLRCCGSVLRLLVAAAAPWFSLPSAALPSSCRHMQFLDDAPSSCLECSILRHMCPEGSRADSSVRRISQARVPQPRRPPATPPARTLLPAASTLTAASHTQTAMIAWLFATWAHYDISQYTGAWLDVLAQQHLALSRLQP